MISKGIIGFLKTFKPYKSYKVFKIFPSNKPRNESRRWRKGILVIAIE
jgi:hypothetical protein